MDFGKPGNHQPGVASSDASPVKCETMPRWRWLLFAFMARYETGEAAYLSIPAAKLNRRDVAVRISGPETKSSRILAWLGRRSSKV